MKNKTKKLLSTLVLGLMITGCDVNALPSDYEETYGAIKMEDVYDTVRNGQGEAALYNQLIERIAELEINAASRQKELYARIQDKIDTMIEDQYTKVTYGTKAGDEAYTTEVEEDKLLKYYKSQGYKISNSEDATKTGSTSKCWDAEAVLTDSKYVNTYISDTLKSEVLTSMLNEQYIREKKASSLYKTKQLRQIEYVYIDFDPETDSYEDITKFDEGLRNGTITNLETQIADEWKKVKKETILENAKKAGTSEDEDGKYYTEFSSCGGNVNKCANEKLYAVDETEYYTKAQIYTNTDSPLLSAMTDTIFSSTFYTERKKADGTYEIHEDVIKDPVNGYYYLKSQSDVDLGTDSVINVDTSTNKYYFVRIEMVENINPNTEGATYNSKLVSKYKEEGKDDVQKIEYAIAEALATTASNYSNSVIHYLNKYSIAINDDKFFEYVFDTYGYPEEEE